MRKAGFPLPGSAPSAGGSGEILRFSDRGCRSHCHTGSLSIIRGGMSGREIARIFFLFSGNFAKAKQIAAARRGRSGIEAERHPAKIRGLAPNRIVKQRSATQPRPLNSRPEGAVPCGFAGDYPAQAYRACLSAVQYGIHSFGKAFSDCGSRGQNRSPFFTIFSLSVPCIFSNKFFTLDFFGEIC